MNCKDNCKIVNQCRLNWCGDTEPLDCTYYRPTTKYSTQELADELFAFVRLLKAQEHILDVTRASEDRVSTHLLIRINNVINMAEYLRDIKETI